jgi:diguanylate cyclase (GGDEF)-like protein/PAS domain S-box-containing protein
MESNSSISKKVLLFVSVALITFSAILILLNYADQKRKLEQAQQDYYNTFRFSYQKIIDRHNAFYLKQLQTMTDSKALKIALKARDREALYRLCIDRWEMLKQENRFLTVMHFHLPDGTSFLRMHRPEKFGDDIASLRPMIAAVHRERKVLTGFEEGHFQIPYRTIVPIFHEGEYIGALELGARPDQILYEMQYFFDMPGAIFVSNERLGMFRENRELMIDGYTLQYKVNMEDALLNTLAPSGYHFAAHDHITLDAFNYNAYAFNLKDFLGNTTAKIVFFEETTRLWDTFYESVWKLIALLAVLSTLLIYIIHYGFRKFVGILDRTNQKLTEQQNFMQSVFDGSHQAIVVTDNSGIIISMNKVAETMLGYASSELVGRSTILSYLSPEDIAAQRQRFESELGRSVEAEEIITGRLGGGLQQEEWCYIHKSGEHFPVKVHLQPLIDAQGRVKGMVTFSEDISEKKSLVRELQRQKDELETILQIAKDGVVMLDREGHFIYVNSSYRRATGYEEEALMQKQWIDITVESECDQLEQVIHRAFTDGSIENFENTIINQAGERVILNVSIVRMPDKQRILMTTKNITDAKRYERRITDYVKLVDENIITSRTDLDGNITYVSEAFSTISGYAKEELLGKNHRIVRHPDMPDEVYADLWKTLTGDGTWRGELKNRKKGGGFYWVDATISPIFDEYGTKVGYTAIRQDITDKKRIEELSITDALTRLYNRRYFNRQFPEFIQEAARDNGLVCFLMIDVDHFKQYNDTYGHQKGDEVLARVAEAIKGSLNRDDDYCFRLGGEEFGVLFKAGGTSMAERFSEQIRHAVEGLGIVHAHNSAADVVTISLGLTCHHATAMSTTDQWYKEADEMLYRAKENGRNRLEIICR